LGQTVKKIGFPFWLLVVSSSLFAQTPAVSEGGVVNGASFAAGQPITAGSLVSIFGTNLAAATALADSIPLSTSLGNVTVTFNGISAPLLAVIHGTSNDQINAQVPWDVLQGATSGTASVVVTSGGAASAPAAVQVGPFSPGVFSLQFGVGQAIAINSDGTLAAAAGSVPGLQTHPAPIGSMVIILATGLGAVDPPVANGQNSLDQLRTAITTPTVLIGGVPAQVTFAGLSPQFVGVNKINATIASGTPTGNAVPVQLQEGGITTTDKVTMAVSGP
jgi:uncharacterized protein (TIGR03437 family)